MDQAASYAIAEAKSRGLTEVGPDQLLLGCLQSIARFGVVSLGSWTFDLEDLGIAWLEDSEKSKAKVAYAQQAVALFDLAARIARADGADRVRVEHLMVAFAPEESGLMGKLKRKHSITSATWRAAVAELGSKPSASAPTNGAVVAREPGHPDYLTPEQAAETLGIHVQTLRGYVRSGKLPALRLAGERSIRIRRTDLEQVLEPLVPQNLPASSPE
jgi:excisionase family DNA binding protein